MVLLMCPWALLPRVPMLLFCPCLHGGRRVDDPLFQVSQVVFFAYLLACLEHDVLLGGSESVPHVEEQRVKPDVLLP